MTEPTEVFAYNNTPPFNPESGLHLWGVVVTCAFDPDTGLIQTAAPLQLSDPGCLYCALPYSPLVDKRRCKGRIRKVENLL